MDDLRIFRAMAWLVLIGGIIVVMLINSGCAGQSDRNRAIDFIKQARNSHQVCVDTGKCHLATGSTDFHAWAVENYDHVLDVLRSGK